MNVVNFPSNELKNKPTHAYNNIVNGLFTINFNNEGCDIVHFDDNDKIKKFFSKVANSAQHQQIQVISLLRQPDNVDDIDSVNGFENQSTPLLLYTNYESKTYLKIIEFLRSLNDQ